MVTIKDFQQSRVHPFRNPHGTVSGIALRPNHAPGLYIMDADSNLVLGCYIGTDATGTIALSNGSDGLQLNVGSSHNIIGGSGIGDRNIISGNGRDGILIGADCSHNEVINTLIGADRTGTNPLGNTEQGVSIGNGAMGDSAHNNTIGPGNTIAYNGEYGIVVLGEAVEKNTVTQNSITGNGYSGIFHREGGNNDLGPPVITSVTGTRVKGTTCPNCTVEIFSDPEDEGKVYEGTTTADGSGKFSLNVSVVGPEVTATATDGDGNTSEFSPPYGTAVTIIVTKTNDSGYRSLRWAMEQANNHAGPDTIVFNIPDTDPGFDSSTGVWTIQPQSELPDLRDGETVIDGTTQAAFVGSDTNPRGPEIEIDGTNTGGYTDGLYLHSARNVIRDLVINRFPSNGIRISDADTNVVVACYIGTDASGTVSLANAYNGIQLNGGASYNMIGGSSQGEGNLISGNGWDGILVGANCSRNHVINNLIGTDRSGSDSLGNGDYGVEIGNGASGDSAHENVVGPGNTIAFNGLVGVRIVGPLVVGNTITQNAITQNGTLGIDNFGGNTELTPPTIHDVSASSVSGTVCPYCRVEVFSDPEDEGKMYEGTTLADEFGNFQLNVEVTGPYVTATATDAAGNTSEFSEPVASGPPAGGRIVVTNTNDSGEGSLRQAILDANYKAGPDTIVFNISDSDPGYHSGTGVWTIQPLTAFNTLMDNGTVIDGSSQAAFIGSDTNPHGPEIEIDGTYAGNASGFGIESANNVIKNLVINRFGGDIWRGGRGIRMSETSATGSVVVGCYIGTDATGMVALGNKYGGVSIEDGASGNRIGGSAPDEGNVISGTLFSENVITGSGITIGHIGSPEIDNNDNIIKGNYIGTNRNGTEALPNTAFGIVVYKGRRNIIGGSAANEANVIAGNESTGLLILGSRSTDNIVVGNYIGIAPSGSIDLRNGRNGIGLESGAQNNTIGPGNLIAFNNGNGVYVAYDTTTGNTITQNSITNNEDLGINNFAGGNTELAPPIIASVTADNVSGTTCPGCIVEVFSDPEDEGKIYEGTTTADGSGNFTLTVSVTGPYVTATATDGDGNTSQFSDPYEFSVCQRGDVNCDGNITPGDALCAFWRSILGGFQEECECECSEQAAEVNCDGNITPGDALCIFWRSILGDWTEECRCPAAKVAVRSPSVDVVRVESVEAAPGERVRVPIAVKNPQGLDALALQLTYPPDLLEFEGVSATQATEGWLALDGVKAGSGMVTLGGFHTEGISCKGAIAIAEVIFTIKQEVDGRGEFDVWDLGDDLAGARVERGSFVVKTPPAVFSLSQNYPNPFNPTTTISFTIPMGAGRTTERPPLTTLRIFNLLGQEVRTLVDEVQEAGSYTVTWDGRNGSGQEVPSGIYFYRLTVKGLIDTGLSRTGQVSETRRMVLMK